MKNTQQLKQEIREEFDKKFVRSDGLMDKYQNEWSMEDIQTTAEAIKDFIIQSYITLAKEKIKELEGKKWTKENCPISKMEYEIRGVEFMRGKVDGHNQAKQEEIDKWKQIKDLLIKE